MARDRRGISKRSKIHGRVKSTEEMDLMASAVEDMQEGNVEVFGEDNAPEEKMPRRSADEFVIKNVRVKLAVVLDKLEEIEEKIDIANAKIDRMISLITKQLK